MFTSKRTFLTVARNCALLGLLLAGFVLGGCSSCKQYEEQIMQLDSQIADLQRQVAEKESSNVHLEEEIPVMMVTQRTYEANLKVLQTQNKMLGSVLDIIG